MDLVEVLISFSCSWSLTLQWTWVKVMVWPVPGLCITRLAVYFPAMLIPNNTAGKRHAHVCVCMFVCICLYVCVLFRVCLFVWENNVFRVVEWSPLQVKICHHSIAAPSTLSEHPAGTQIFVAAWKLENHVCHSLGGATERFSQLVGCWRIASLLLVICNSSIVSISSWSVSRKHVQNDSRAVHWVVLFRLVLRSLSQGSASTLHASVVSCLDYKCPLC